MRAQRGRHVCEDCGDSWPCTDPICDDTPITVCAACVEARERWALEYARRQEQQQQEQGGSYANR